jgi:osmotically-inducible protein OsmY
MKHLLCVCAVAMATLGASAAAAPDESAQEMVAKVRRALAHVPYYGVFDFLAFKVDKGVVTLQGYAHRPSLKKEAEAMVRRATNLDVANQIELLPAADFDDRIRWDVYQRVYTEDFADKYVSGGGATIRSELVTLARFPDMEPFANYPVHIIVKNRRVALLGSVADEFDKTALLIRVKQAPSTAGVDDLVMVRARG